MLIFQGTLSPHGHDAGSQGDPPRSPDQPPRPPPPTFQQVAAGHSVALPANDYFQSDSRTPNPVFPADQGIRDIVGSSETFQAGRAVCVSAMGTKEHQRQDHAAIQVSNDDRHGEVVTAVVSDGASFCRCSAIGAHLAVRSLNEEVQAALREAPSRAELVERLLGHSARVGIIAKWKVACAEHSIKNPLSAAGAATFKDAWKDQDQGKIWSRNPLFKAGCMPVSEYGATLSAVVVLGNKIIFYQLGNSPIRTIRDDGIQTNFVSTTPSSDVSDLLHYNSAAVVFQCKETTLRPGQGPLRVLLHTDGLADLIARPWHFRPGPETHGFPDAGSMTQLDYGHSLLRSIAETPTSGEILAIRLKEILSWRSMKGLDDVTLCSLTVGEKRPD